MNLPYELYLHVGYPKTGTTFLQQEVFPKIKGTNYIPSIRVRPETSRITRQDEFSFNYDEIKSHLESHFSAGKNILSNEGLTGDFFHGKLINNKLIADRLKQLFPHAKIIITLRNQYDLIESLYKQYIHVGGTKRLRDFIGFRQGHFDYSYRGRDSIMNPGMFNYLNFIAYYEKLFGKNNLFVIPFELLKKDPHQFVAKLLSWIGIQGVPAFRNTVYNPGFGARQIAVARLLNRFLKSKFRETGIIPNITLPLAGQMSTGRFRFILQSNLSQRLLGKKAITDLEIKTEIKKIFAESNRMLNQKYDLHLEELCPGEYF